MIRAHRHLLLAVAFTFALLLALAYHLYDAQMVDGVSRVPAGVMQEAARVHAGGAR